MSDDLYIWINRWQTFQHYRPNRERGPAWIKDYTAQLDDDRYLSLTDKQRALLADLRRMFSMSRAQLRHDRRAISSRRRMKTYHLDIEALNHAGFIEVISRETLELRLELLYTGSSPEVEVELETPPTPPGGNGHKPLTAKDLRRYTGCKMTRGTHGQGWKHDPLGTDKPPPDWPHDKPTRLEVEAALVATAEDEFPF